MSKLSLALYCPTFDLLEASIHILNQNGKAQVGLGNPCINWDNAPVTLVPHIYRHPVQTLNGNHSKLGTGWTNWSFSLMYAWHSKYKGITKAWSELVSDIMDSMIDEG